MTRAEEAKIYKTIYRKLTNLEKKTTKKIRCAAERTEDEALQRGCMLSLDPEQGLIEYNRRRQQGDIFGAIIPVSRNRKKVHSPEKR